jgi:hypothetical protein
MIDYEKLKRLNHELEKLRDFLHGAHLATSQDEASGTFHHACHKLDEILKEYK